MYKTKKSLLGKISACVLAVAMLMSLFTVSSFAAGETPLEEGTYEIGSSGLSLYISAMGGIEFAEGIYKGATVEVDSDGNADITLNFGKGNVTIYTINCDTFIQDDPVVNSTSYTVIPGYYDSEGIRQDAAYTVSSDTALDNNGQSVNYVDSMTFPVSDYADTYTLWLYVNSNVMGCQFGDGSGLAGSNMPGSTTAYKAILTIDWSSASKIAEPDESSNQSADVEYIVDGGYEVKIPSTITVDSATQKGNYTITAENFVIGENSYVTVSSPESGSLSNGSDTLSFTNTLESGNLTSSGDTLSGTIEVTDFPVNPGKYTGTINFTINYFSGE